MACYDKLPNVAPKREVGCCKSEKRKRGLQNRELNNCRSEVLSWWQLDGQIEEMDDGKLMREKT